MGAAWCSFPCSPRWGKGQGAEGNTIGDFPSDLPLKEQGAAIAPRLLIQHAAQKACGYRWQMLEWSLAYTR